MKARVLIYLFLSAILFAGCSHRVLPPFGSGSQWSLNGNTVSNNDIAVNFGGGQASPLFNASDGSYDLHFITTQDQFNSLEPRCAGYLADVISQIPLRIDSICVILADEFMILSPGVLNNWMPDYVRRADGVLLNVEANPVESPVQPHDQLWRNLIINKSKRQIIVVDRIVKSGKHFAIVYVLQSQSKRSPLTRGVHYDVTSPLNVQSIGTHLEYLLGISANALESSPATAGR